MSVNKILIALIAMLLGTGVMLSAGSIIGENEYLLKEIVIEVTEIDLIEEPSPAPNLVFDLDNTSLTILEKEYILNNFDTVYNITTGFVGSQSGNDIIDNGTIDYFGYYQESDDYVRYVGNIGVLIMFDKPSFGTRVLIRSEYVPDPFEPFTLELSWQTEEYTTLGRLTNVATITMVIAIISTATYITLKGRAKA